MQKKKKKKKKEAAAEADRRAPEFERRNDQLQVRHQALQLAVLGGGGEARLNFLRVFVFENHRLRGALAALRRPMQTLEAHLLDTILLNARLRRDAQRVKSLPDHHSV